MKIATAVGVGSAISILSMCGVIIWVTIILMGFSLSGCNPSEYKYPVRDVDHIYVVIHFDSAKVRVIESYYTTMMPLHWHLSDTLVAVYFRDIRGDMHFFYNDMNFRIVVIPEEDIYEYRQDIDNYYTKEGVYRPK